MDGPLRGPSCWATYPIQALDMDYLQPDLFRAALGPIAYFITSELTPQQYRATTQSIALAADSIFNFIFSFATLPIYESIGVWSFIPLFIVPSTFCLIYLFFALPETKNREIHEILLDLKSGWSWSRRRSSKIPCEYKSCDEDSVITTISTVSISSVIMSSRFDVNKSAWNINLRIWKIKWKVWQ